MENNEVYEIQMFNIIEEIEDMIDAAGGQNDAGSSLMEIQVLDSE
jgi:hypothetical protein